ncbi:MULTISPECIES: hypothetical protein [unclassified Streptomyces]|uniref:hypothetical protein n=1 Tax=unclassified Streptomyces TaxID=2593676 RepID=UPI0038304313
MHVPDLAGATGLGRLVMLRRRDFLDATFASVAAQHRHEEAVALWSRSLDFMDGVTSDRNRKEIRSIRSATAGYRRRRIPGAGALHRRAADLLRAQA